MALKRSGQFVLFRFPQTDLTVGKLRPALLLAPLPTGHDDWLVCMVSSQANQAVIGVDEVLTPNDLDFAQSGLKVPSVIRLTRLAVASESIFLGAIGEISTRRLGNMKTRLARWIESN